MKDWSITKLRRSMMTAGVFTLAAWQALFLNFLAGGSGVAILGILSPVGLLAGAWLVARALVTDEEE